MLLCLTAVKTFRLRPDVFFSLQVDGPITTGGGRGPRRKLTVFDKVEQNIAGYRMGIECEISTKKRYRKLHGYV